MLQSLSVLTVILIILRDHDSLTTTAYLYTQWEQDVTPCPAQNTNKTSTYLVLFVLSEGLSTVNLCNTGTCIQNNKKLYFTKHSSYSFISFAVQDNFIRVFDTTFWQFYRCNLKNSSLTPVNKEDKLRQLHKLSTGVFGLEFRTFATHSHTMSSSTTHLEEMLLIQYS